MNEIRFDSLARPGTVATVTGIECPRCGRLVSIGPDGLSFRDGPVHVTGTTLDTCAHTFTVTHETRIFEREIVLTDWRDVTETRGALPPEQAPAPRRSWWSR